VSDVTPVVGPVYGWRTWNVDGNESWALDGEPPRLTSRGGPWKTATQQAECRKDTLSDMAAMMRAMYPREYKHEEPAEHEPVTEPSCWCGLYAHATLANCLDKNGHLTYDEDDLPLTQVLGLVSASGRMIAAERGFRAQWMTVDTLVCIHQHDGGHQGSPVAAIADGLAVDHVCVKVSSENRVATREAFNSLFAHRDGIYLWRKEAPWTSDVTNEATKSSTPFHRGGTVPGMSPASFSMSFDPVSWPVNWRTGMPEPKPSFSQRVARRMFNVGGGDS
jgi:hypothetical protein